jgi:4-hydroxybenzoate polyprenyltransferase
MEAVQSNINENDNKKKAQPDDNKKVNSSICKPWSIFNWVQFLNERAPPLIFLLLAAGPCLTALQVIEGNIDWEKLWWALPGQLVLLLMIRVMDDVKDYKLDLVVHPERPLPRGLIDYNEVIDVINIVTAGLSVYTAFVAWRYTIMVGVAYSIQLIYTHLMYHEFWLGKWFEDKVFLYALTHQISIYFGAWFLCLLSGASWCNPIVLLLGSVAFSGFFTYEICRKLDPTLPLIKGTYLVVYGKWMTLLMVSFTIAVGAITSYYLNMNWLLWPMEALMITSLIILFVVQSLVPDTKAHKLVEALSVMYLLVHMWSGYINGLWK